ncbi:MAG: hypothetical protein A2177_08590 [Spirochaetes bacterium RBG_13_68_11]|nr:MAG: hypothetical protein A2177_08590 [Spirochaetes bacterium RBG_13_68_11]
MPLAGNPEAPGSSGKGFRRPVPSRCGWKRPSAYAVATARFSLTCFSSAMFETTAERFGFESPNV